jgi:hypothetical protein
MRNDRSVELAYLVGALQGDGSFYYDKANKQYVVRIEVNDRDFIEQFYEFLKKVISPINVKIYKKRKSKLMGVSLRAKKIVDFFRKHEVQNKYPPIPPQWISEDIKYFGSYLAGIIDSDGDVTTKRPKYPQCLVRITSGAPQKELKGMIIKYLNCGSSIVKSDTFAKKWNVRVISWKTQFYISSKNFDLIEKYLLPYLAIERKREKVKKYIRLRRNR